MREACPCPLGCKPNRKKKRERKDIHLTGIIENFPVYCNETSSFDSMKDDK